MDPAVDVVSLGEIRSEFPALEREHAGHAVAYFDGPGGTQVPRRVALAASAYLLYSNANRRWAYPSSAETDAVVEGAREAVADLIGCRPGDVSFGANMTSLAFHLSRTLARRFGPGDEVVVTRLDHMANVAPWTTMAAERGMTVREVPFDPATGRLDTGRALEAIGPRTRLVAVGWASNALGTVVEVEPIVARAREVGSLTFVDAVHAAPHFLPDVDDLGCDFLALSAYKLYGPHVGAMFARAERMDALDPPRLPCSPQTSPERFELGTLPFEGLAGLHAAVDFLTSLSYGDTRRERLTRAYEGLRQRAEPLFERLWEGLTATPGVTCYGPPPGSPRTPTVSFRVAGLTPRAVAAQLAAHAGVFVSHGHFYAAHVPRDLGVPEGLVRAGCACYTTEEEVERLVEGVRALG